MVLRRSNIADHAQLTPTRIRRAVDGEIKADAAIIDNRGVTLTTTILRTDDPDVIVREVSALWLQAQRSFLAIGRYLLQAREGIGRRLREEGGRLTGPELRIAFQNELRCQVLDRLPFGAKVAHQLETVARAVFETGRLREDELPASYSVAYQLTTLTDEEFAAAKAEGLVGRAVRREELIDLKRRLRTETTERLTQLRARRSRLVSTISRIQRELAAVEAQLRHDEKLLGEQAVQ
jgi:hypothetical protein